MGGNLGRSNVCSPGLGEAIEKDGHDLRAQGTGGGGRVEGRGKGRSDGGTDEGTIEYFKSQRSIACAADFNSWVFWLNFKISVLRGFWSMGPLPVFYAPSSLISPLNSPLE